MLISKFDGTVLSASYVPDFTYNNQTLLLWPGRTEYFLFGPLQ